MTPPLSHCHTWIGETQWAYSVQLANLTHGVHWDARQQAGRGEGMEWRGREWSGVEWRGGEGRAGQGRAGQGARLLRWTFTASRSTRPWNGQPPSTLNDNPHDASHHCTRRQWPWIASSEMMFVDYFWCKLLVEIITKSSWLDFNEIFSRTWW